ncbi:aminopeptidase P family protein [Aureimonas mangrovi]|uniref:aminopeptidase P family protein n=1 Tax=Aureimonas mangrovi TaxID=2758041 RepID=UPI00163D6F27|nr:aminopeptidase P family protein [Aureimonas mangrovi]
MFQTFEEAGSSAESASRVDRLRTVLSQAGVDGFLVPRADEFQGEYIPANAERLRWLTGFTGSAGHAVVFPDRAYAFSDGRYTVQLGAQLDGKVFAASDSTKTTLPDFLKENAQGLKIGFDPWLHTVGEVAALRKAASEAGFELVALSRNPIDLVWQDRPAAPATKARVHSERYAGRSAKEKLAVIDAEMAKSNAALCVLSDPTTTAWVLNLRGSDVPHTPLVLAFALLRRGEKPILFLDPARLDAEDRGALEDQVELAAPESFERTLRSLAANTRVMLDPTRAARRIADIVESSGGEVVEARDPAILPRARKNEIEIAGSRAAHLRDGAAIVSFLAWLDAQPVGSLTEIDAASKLADIRAAFGEKDGMALRDISFDTISAAGPNAALPHYRVTTASNRRIEGGTVYLVDSGGQYDDGTTDITRTIAIGAPAAEIARAFTLVLKGMIAISRARFPKGTRGSELDPLARIALWKAGMDFAHGTGHGVGSFLSVHEGPQSISRRGVTPLEAGMIVSNEPGYYREGAFGIRIENLLLTLPAEPVPGGDLPMHGFETLTFAPIDRRLIVAQLLDAEERSWLDAYHAEVVRRTAPLLDEADATWLRGVARPLED